jgi:hypothetical protein
MHWNVQKSYSVEKLCAGIGAGKHAYYWLSVCGAGQFSPLPGTQIIR